MKWITKCTALVLAVVLSASVSAVPAMADPTYDFAVTGSAVANTTTLPSIITWTIDVASVGDVMGFGGAQEGIVEFVTPSTISLTLSNDCDVTGHTVVCSWFVGDAAPHSFEISGLVTLLATGTISIVPTVTMSSPRTDSNATNDSATISCTAVTSLLVTC